MGSAEKIPLSGRRATIPRAVTEGGGMGDFFNPSRTCIVDKWLQTHPEGLESLPIAVGDWH